MNKAQPFMDVEADDGSAPTFSEKFLYETVGKGDARFILGVAEEYDHVIRALGPAAVKAILQVKPALAVRLGVGEQVTKSLEDARSDEDLWREGRIPAQVILDHDAAHAIWQVLHDEYSRFFDVSSMDKDHLRAYRALTEGLGEWEQDAMRKADEERPAMTERHKPLQEARIERKRRVREAKQAMRAALDNGGDLAAATREYLAALDR
jgi:hypothetical protein